MHGPAVVPDALSVLGYGPAFPGSPSLNIRATGCGVGAKEAPQDREEGSEESRRVAVSADGRVFRAITAGSRLSSSPVRRVPAASRGEEGPSLGPGGLSSDDGRDVPVDRALDRPAL